MISLETRAFSRAILTLWPREAGLDSSPNMNRMTLPSSALP